MLTLQVLPNQGMYTTDCKSVILIASGWDSLFSGVSYCDGRGVYVDINYYRIKNNAVGIAYVCLCSYIENCTGHSRNPYLGHNVIVTRCSSTS